MIYRARYVTVEEFPREQLCCSARLREVIEQRPAREMLLVDLSCPVTLPGWKCEHCGAEHPAYSCARLAGTKDLVPFSVIHIDEVEYHGN